MRRKEDRSKQGQTNNKVKQHSTPKSVTYILMRDEKEGIKKQARSNKQGKATQHTPPSHYMYTYIHIYMYTCIYVLYLSISQYGCIVAVKATATEYSYLHT